MAFSRSGAAKSAALRGVFLGGGRARCQSGDVAAATLRCVASTA
jgi:hypothetical protein